MGLFPNLAVELPLDQYVSQDKVVRLLNISKENKFDYSKNKKMDTLWVK
jgi:hypothetical protein